MIALNYAMLPADQPVRVSLVYDCHGLDEDAILKMLAGGYAKYLELDDPRKPIHEITIAVHSVGAFVDMNKVKETFHSQVAHAQAVDSPFARRLSRICFRVHHTSNASEAHAVGVQVTSLPT